MAPTRLSLASQPIRRATHSQFLDGEPGSGMRQCLVSCGFQAFRKILSEDQRRAFAGRALLGIHHVTLHVSQAGVVLLYAILAQAGHLTGAEVSSMVGFRRSVAGHTLSLGAKFCHMRPTELCTTGAPCAVMGHWVPGCCTWPSVHLLTSAPIAACK